MRLPALCSGTSPWGSPHQVGSSPFACTFEPHPQGSYLQGQSGGRLEGTQSLALRVRARTGSGVRGVKGGGSSCKGWQESHVRGCLRFDVIGVCGGWGHKS